MSRLAIIHLPRRTRVWINGIGLGVWVTGAGWLLAHYFFEMPNSLGLPSNSSEVLWLKVHGAFAFLSLWTGGMLWGVHVLKAWRLRRHRWSGGVLFTALLALIITGYFLYYVAGDEAREIISKTHWILGLAFPVLYLIHRITKYFSTRRAR